MPFLITYLLKLSVSLAVVFLFYYFILRKLTFYNHNRWYLLGYTVVSFFIPLINISSVLEKNNWDTNSIVTWVPVLHSGGTEAPAAVAAKAPYSTWDLMLAIIAVGILIMIVRLLVQLFSIRRMMKKAVPLTAEGLQLYQVDADIIPFSFGNSIFINSGLHSEEELKEIIRHEFVHVKQKHSLDIMWAELLCLINWFNPFAWLLKKAIRQNLEFIADNKVLEKGTNKKEYQYLLLKVTGNNQYSIATQFNFSSLKKRIVMMNKTKSAKRQLARLLFLLPATAVLLLAFRRHLPFNESPVSNDTVRFGAIVYDDATKQPIADVLVREEISGLQTYTDENGYFSFDFTAAERKVEKHLWMMKQGYQRHLASFSVAFNQQVKEMGIIGIDAMRQGNTGEVCTDCVSSISLKDENNPAHIDYHSVKDYFEQALKNGGQPSAVPFGNKWETIREGNTIRVIFADTIPSKANESGIGSFIKRNADVKSVAWRHKDGDDALYIRITRKDGTVEEYNLEDDADVRRAEAKYGKLPTAPPPPPAPPAPPSGVVVEERPAPPALTEIRVEGVPLPPSPPFAGEVREVRIEGEPLPPQAPLVPKLPGNVEKINISNKKVTLTLKNGQEEKYDLNNPDEKKKFEKKYGDVLPALPRVPAVSREGRTTSARSTSDRATDRTIITAAGEPLYVKDGVITTISDLDALNPSSIHHINVLKGTNATNAYGIAAKDGVVEITTKSAAAGSPVTAVGYKSEAVTKNGANDVILSNPEINITRNDKLVLLDGKEKPAGAIHLKGNFKVRTLSEEEAVKKYGEKGKKGALEITTVN